MEWNGMRELSLQHYHICCFESIHSYSYWLPRTEVMVAQLDTLRQRALT